MLKSTLTTVCLLALTGCAHYLPSDGPSLEAVNEIAVSDGFVQVITIDAEISARLRAQIATRSFAEAFSDADTPAEIGRGDTLEVTIWESPPATLFGGTSTDLRTPSTSRAMALPEQVVDRKGEINVPFVGRLQAAGLSPQALESQIVQRLKGKANQPEVLVRLVRNASSVVTVVGEVTTSTRLPLTPSGERVLDALAAAGGVRQPISKTMLQITRGSVALGMPLDLVIREPLQNILLQPGDVVTAISQPLSFTALGATGRNEEIAFEMQGLSLAQALARAGGLNDSRSSAKGVFVFRFEAADALAWPRRPLRTTPDGRVPVVYRIDLSNPASFFVMQDFAINHRDVLYVSNAPATELQKFLNLVFSVAYPLLTTISITR